MAFAMMSLLPGVTFAADKTSDELMKEALTLYKKADALFAKSIKMKKENSGVKSRGMGQNTEDPAEKKLISQAKNLEKKFVSKIKELQKHRSNNSEVKLRAYGDYGRCSRGDNYRGCSGDAYDPSTAHYTPLILSY